MSFHSYKDGQYDVSWDFQCPDEECGAMWNNEGDPIGEGEEVEEACPGCKKVLLVTASYSVDYELVEKPSAPSNDQETL